MFEHQRLLVLAWKISDKGGEPVLDGLILSQKDFPNDKFLRTFY